MGLTARSPAIVGTATLVIVVSSTFDAPGDEAPLWLQTKGLSKGQAFVNGHNLGRYFTSTATGKAIGPQTHLLIPPAWLREDGGNELLLFDEHGALPQKVRLVHRETGDLDE